jgi:hypothetical protein
MFNKKNLDSRMQITNRTLGPNATMTIQSRMPTCVLPDYWARHGLSRKDIDTIVAYIPTKVIWMCAIMYGVPCPWFTLRCSSASVMDITLSGKSLAIDLLVKQAGLTPHQNCHKLDVDSVESFEHIPPIPRHTITREDFTFISRGITSQLLPRRLLTTPDSIGVLPVLYHFNNADWVPVGIEGDAICCNAIQTESSYTYQVGGGYTHEPMIGNYRGVIYCLTDELILLTAD